MTRLHTRLLVLLLLSAAGYLLISLAPDWLPYTENRRIQHENISYDRRVDPTPREVVVGKEPFPGFARREINIHFRMFVYRIGEYDNVFQTAPGNEGLRLELSKAGHLALVIPEKAGGGKNVRGIYLTKRLQVGQWYLVRVRIDRFHRLEAWLNTLPVIDIRDATWAYALSDLAVGTGFSRTRPFDGKVDSFFFSYETWKPKVFLLLALLSLRTLFAALLLTPAVLLGFAVIKNASHHTSIAWTALSAWVQRQAYAENLVLFHFLLCSAGLLKLLMQAGDLFGRQLSSLAPVPFNAWSLRFVFPSKPADLVSYLASVCVLPAYYAGAYLVLRRRQGSACRFFANLVERRWGFWGYLALLTCGNFLVVCFIRLFGDAPMSALQVTLWLCIFLLPWSAAPDPDPPLTAQTHSRPSSEDTP